MHHVILSISGIFLIYLGYATNATPRSTITSGVNETNYEGENMDATMNIKRRAAIVLAATGLMLSVGSGAALAANFNGTDGADTLTGTKSADTMRSLDKNDVLKGLGGDDSLDGGRHKDTLLGGSGRDSLEGSLGDDRLVGGADNDHLRGAGDQGDVDKVSCGDGTNDTAIVDQFDVLVDNSCENVILKETAAPAPIPEPGG
jgi:Ca2+-binding RTX toxin-like protein